MNIKRGSIYVAALDPVIGKEISKTRPVVVVSHDINNQYSGTVTIVPITSKNLQKIYPFEVLLAKGTENLTKSSKIKCNQIRTLDITRIVKFIGPLNKEIVKQIDTSIKIHLALP